MISNFLKLQEKAVNRISVYHLLTFYSFSLLLVFIGSVCICSMYTPTHNSLLRYLRVSYIYHGPIYPPNTVYSLRIGIFYITILINFIYYIDTIFKSIVHVPMLSVDLIRSYIAFFPSSTVSSPGSSTPFTCHVSLTFLNLQRSPPPSSFLIDIFEVYWPLSPPFC